MSFRSSENNTFVIAEQTDKVATSTLQPPGGEMMSAALFESAPANEGDRIRVASPRSNGDISSITATRAQPKTGDPSVETMAALEEELSSMLQELTASPKTAQGGERRAQTPEIDRRHDPQHVADQHEQKCQRENHQGHHHQGHHHQGQRSHQRPHRKQQPLLQNQQAPINSPILEVMDAVGGARSTKANDEGNENTERLSRNARAVKSRLEAEVDMWKRNAEMAQRSYRMMMSQAQASEQTRMKQVAELSLLREERMALARANDAKAEDLLRTREALEETRAEVATLKNVLRGPQHTQTPRRPWPFALSPTVPSPTPLLVPYAGSPEEHAEAFASEPTGMSSWSTPRPVMALGGWGREHETVPGAASCPVQKTGRAGAWTMNRSPRTAHERRSSAGVSQQGIPIRSTSRAKSGAKSREADRETWEQNGGGSGDGGAS